MKLDVESLRALRTVVDTGTFTEAANRLGMTQSAVSWKIKRLEERVGINLVKRGSEIEATPDGRDLLIYAARILEAHDDAVAHLSRSDIEGVVRLGTNEDLRGGALADVLARFGRMYAQSRLEVRVELSGVVCEWLDDGDVDLAVVQVETNEVRPDDVVLWTEQLQWVHSTEHSFEIETSIPVVTFGPGLAYLETAEESLRRSGVQWRNVLQCPMLSGVQTAVEAGLGVAALNPRNITERMTTWDYNERHPLPELSEVIRTGPGGDAVLLTALRETLTAALAARHS